LVSAETKPATGLQTSIAATRSISGTALHGSSARGSSPKWSAETASAVSLTAQNAARPHLPDIVHDLVTPGLIATITLHRPTVLCFHGRRRANEPVSHPSTA
jgi:hypothetical protein